MDALKELADELQAHFPEEAISSRQDISDDAVYAHTWAYQDRLDEVFGLAWHSSIDWPHGLDGRSRCVLTVWVGDEAYTREAYGKPGGQFGATEAQAFKRACSAFGIGRYLYHYDGPMPEGAQPPKRGGGGGDRPGVRTQKQADYMDSLGSRLYGVDWRNVRNDRVRELTGGSRQLSMDEASALIEEFKAALDNPGPPAMREEETD